MTRPAAAAACTIRPYEPADEPAVLDLLQLALGGGPVGKRSLDFFRWKHQRSPFGASLALVAELDGQVVGLRTFMRWRFCAGASTVRAVRAVDTATHPDYQGRGIFTRLTHAALDAVRSDTDLVFNTPNAKSLPGYLKMGWSTVGVVPVALRPVRLMRFAAGVRRAARGAPSGPPPSCVLPRADEVLADADGVAALLAAGRTDPSRLATHRTVEYLRWRYADAPDLDYRALTIHDGGELAGLAIGRPRARGPLAELTLAEVLVRAGDRRAARRLLRAAVGAGCDYVATHLTPRTEVASAGPIAGYFAVPRLGMSLVAHPLADVRPDPLALSSWRFSLGDLEVF